MPRLTAGSTTAAAAQRLRRRLREAVGTRRPGGVARVEAQPTAQLQVLRLQLGDHHIALRQRRNDHRELLPQPDELLAQLSNGSSVIGHRAIINTSRSRSSRRAAADLTSY